MSLDLLATSGERLSVRPPQSTVRFRAGKEKSPSLNGGFTIGPGLIHLKYEY